MGSTLDDGVVRRVSAIVSSERSLDEMLGEIVGLAVQATACDACLVYLLDRETGEIVLRASQVPHEGDVGHLRMQAGEGITGWVAQHRSAVSLPSGAASDARFKTLPGIVEDTYEALLSVPLVSGGETIGVINVHHREAHRHSEPEIALMTFIGEQMGVAIGRNLLAEENARLTYQLESRKVVERAKGIIQRRNGMTEEDAYLLLRNESRRMRRSMRDLAEAVILSEEMARTHGIS